MYDDVSVPLSPDALAAALSVRDLTDPSAGPHAMQLLVDDIVDALRDRWKACVLRHRGHRIVPVEDNYDRLRYPPKAVARDARYTRYASDTCVLRSHASAMVPAALRKLAGEERAGAASDDVLLACAGVVYRRDSIDRLHTGTPHQLDLWRVVAPTRPSMGDDDLVAMIGAVVASALPGARWRTLPTQHPYTLLGREIEVWDATTNGWIEVGECGLAHPDVLASSGLVDRSGLALGLGLDRLLMLRKGVPDIRILRSSDDRVASQLLDLAPYRAVSAMPAVRRDLSVAVDAAVDAETLGDRVRDALGPDASAVEELAILTETPCDDLPAPARERLGIRSGQKNVLLRLVLRPIDRTLTDDDANDLRDRVYGAIHEGGAHQWARGSRD
ncbi:MAG TPA: hypothetical protein VF230_12575 [Acidimicrobiales bacterium]